MTPTGHVLKMAILILYLNPLLLKLLIDSNYTLYLAIQIVFLHETRFSLPYKLTPFNQAIASLPAISISLLIYYMKYVYKTNVSNFVLYINRLFIALSITYINNDLQILIVLVTIYF